MKTRSFIESSSHKALRRIKEEMGPDVVILSTAEVPGGIEFTVSESSQLEASPVAAVAAPVAAMAAPEASYSNDGAVAGEALSGRQESVAGPRQVWSQDADILSLRKEMEEMRSCLHDRLREQEFAVAEQKLGEPSPMLTLMAAMGLQADIAERFAQRLPAEEAPELQRDVLKMLIARQLPVAAAPDSGVTVFVGPQGAGKTTAIAKIIAQEIRDGCGDALAVLSLDSGRIGGQDQLRSYCRILQLPLHIAQTEEQAITSLKVLGRHRRVLVDTAGLSLSDREGRRKLSAILNTLDSAEVLLALPADRDYHTLREIMHQWSSLPLTGLLATRLDDTLVLGSLLSVMMGQTLPTYLCSDGSSVPDDLWDADAGVLAAMALDRAAIACHEPTINHADGSEVYARA